MNNSSSPDLIKRLEALDYSRLFLFYQTSERDQLWDGGRGRDGLVTVAVDSAVVPDVRFLAAEIVAEEEPLWPDRALASTLGPVYAHALSRGSAENGNNWGLPGESPGPVGGHVLRLGKEAASAFVPLLDDNTRILFEGSEEATLGNAFRFRVKDVAASLIAALMNLSFEVDRDPTRRDARIDALATQLK